MASPKTKGLPSIEMAPRSPAEAGGPSWVAVAAAWRSLASRASVSSSSVRESLAWMSASTWRASGAPAPLRAGGGLGKWGSDKRGGKDAVRNMGSKKGFRNCIMFAMSGCLEGASGLYRIPFGWAVVFVVDVVVLSSTAGGTNIAEFSATVQIPKLGREIAGICVVSG